MTSSATLARVTESTDVRTFLVAATDELTAHVFYYTDSDSLYCHRCVQWDNCEHTARVRLSGLLTNSVVKNVRTRKKETNAATAAKE